MDLDVKEAIRSITVVNPHALMFGTDLPFTRAVRPFQDADIDLIRETLGEALAEKVLYRNAVEWYRPSSMTVG
ncbi:amidohydrolase family protein [Polycladomyces subterraneus]|uniref:amidohydrolase family protein n=1 Tax=Polycladomyces subterraneus TaxID=1016997 RepID=UPI003F4DC2F3